MVTTCLIAVVGYVLAGWGWIDAAYMVTITIFGVGYGEVHPIEPVWLKVFTMAVIFAGCSSLIYVIGGIVQMLTEGEIERMLGTRTMKREIDQLSDHTIICGYGRIGQMLAAELLQHDEPLVVIDRDIERVERATADGFLAMTGDAVNDEDLQKAGLFRARTLATVLPDDARNVFVTLTARDLSETINIIARAESPCTERKLLRGGANSVVMPAAIGAIRIAQLAICDTSGPVALPEDRCRMLTMTSSTEKCEISAPIHGEAEEKLQHSVEELAHLASDLTRTVAQRHIDQVVQDEQCTSAGS